MTFQVGDIVFFPGEGLFLLLGLKEPYIWSCFSFRDNKKRCLFLNRCDNLIARLNP